jgi:hypothetical protein
MINESQESVRQAENAGYVKSCSCPRATHRRRVPRVAASNTDIDVCRELGLPEEIAVHKPALPG